MYVSVPKTCSSSVILNAQHLPAAVRVIEAVQRHPLMSQLPHTGSLGAAGLSGR